MKITSLLFAVLFSFSTFAGHEMITDSREALDVALNDVTTNHAQSVDLINAYKVWHYGPRFGVRIYLADRTKLEYDCGKWADVPMKCELVKETETPTPTPTPGV